MVGLPDRCPAASGYTIKTSRPAASYSRLRANAQVAVVFLVSSILFVAGLLAGIGTANAQSAQTPMIRPIQIDRASFAAFARVADTVIAVGERGVIARRTESTGQWFTQRLPTNRNFTAVAAHPEGLVVAVGHSGMIFVSSDAGATWTAVASQVIEAVNPRKEALLAVAIDSDRRILVTGAFGIMLTSTNLGKTWQRLKPFGDDFEWHLYSITQDALTRGWWIAAEAGTLADSADGFVWRELPSPYKGSFFGGLVTQMGARIAFGMRGQIFRQSQRQGQWQNLPVTTTAAWMAGRVLKDGRVVLLGDQGMVAISQDDGRTFSVQKLWDGSLTDLIETSDGSIWISGVFGLKQFDQRLHPKGAS
ncbi:MAG: hypothetical protein RJA58_791 [Pseudomonadota bacterium]